MADIPKTRTCVSNAEADRLRTFVRGAEFMNGRIAGARVARREDATALAGLLAHESIGPRIYTMPNPINSDTMRGFIDDHLMQRARGDGILFVSFNGAGEATAYFDVELWPQWSIAKFGGAVKAERQGRGFGGAAASLPSSGVSTSSASLAYVRRRHAITTAQSVCYRASASFRWVKSPPSNQTAQRARRSIGSWRAKPGKHCGRCDGRVNGIAESATGWLP